MKHIIPFASIALFAAACEPVASTNPWDPETPPEAQEPGSVAGTIQAVVTLADDEVVGVVPAEGETLIEAATCEPREGDHSGFEVILRAVDTRAGEDAVEGRATLAQQNGTNEGGAFVFSPVPPGRYFLEFVRPGFRVPPPREIEVGVGEDIDLAPLCALNETPPSRPTLASLPAVVDGDNRGAGQDPSADAPIIEVLGCEPGLRYTIEQTPEGVADFDASSTRTVVGADLGEGTCTAELLFSSLSGAPERVTWRVEVTAEDTLGNVSAPSTTFVVRDTLAPLAPDDLAASAGRDRAYVTWDQPPATEGDDGAVGWLVSYALVERARDEGASCPWGAPVSLAGDAQDTAAFALEGPSPIVSLAAEQTLSGVLAGTTLVVQTAAFDEAGNLSCWSPPVRVRPDVVTPALRFTDGEARSGERAAAVGDALVFARGSAGLELAGSSTASDDTISALDVDALGRDLLIAGGAAGVHHGTLAADGTLTLATVDTGDDVRSVDLRPGLWALGTATGVRLVDPADVGGSTAAADPDASGTPARRVRVAGDLVVMVRDKAAPVVQAVARADLATLVGETPALPSEPASWLVRDGRLWLALPDAGVRAYDLAACAGAAGTCLAPVFATSLPGNASPVALAAFDDLVVVAANPPVEGDALGGLFFLRPQGASAPVLVGRTFTEDVALQHVFPRTGGVCATGSDDAGPVRLCFDTVVQPLAEPPVRHGLGVTVLAASAFGADAWVLGTEGVDYRVQQVELSTGAVRASALLPEVATAGNAAFPRGPQRLYPGPVVEGAGFVSLDSYGRAFALAPGGVGLDRIDVDLPASLIAAVSELEVSDEAGVAHLSNALVDADGGTLVAVVQNDDAGGPCRPTALVTIELVEDAAGGVMVGAVAALALPDTFGLNGVAVVDGYAWITTTPFAVTAVNLDTLAVDADRGVGGNVACDATDATALTAFDVQPTLALGGSSVLAAGLEEAGATTVASVFRLDGTSSERLPLQSVGAVVRLGAVGHFVALATDLDGLFLFPIPDEPGEAQAPQLNLPDVSEPTSVQPTRRGVLAGDGASGISWSVLR